MELELASPNEKEKMQMRQYQAQVAPLAPQQPGMGQQMMDMAKQKAMGEALSLGQTGLTSGIKSALAPTVASGVEGGAMLGAGTGGMAALGTAVPYIGAGLLAGKALGLFNEGGQVGPLSPMYKAEGSMTRQQAIALMNNQPDPDRLYDEIISEKMIGKSQGQVMPFTPKSMPTVNQIPQYQVMPFTQKVMPLVGPLAVDPMGADTTYSDEMYKPINT
jgi:hypothetical protein